LDHSQAFELLRPSDTNLAVATQVSRLSLQTSVWDSPGHKQGTTPHKQGP